MTRQHTEQRELEVTVKEKPQFKGKAYVQFQVKFKENESENLLSLPASALESSLLVWCRCFWLVCVYDGSAHEARHKLRRAEASIDTAAVPRIAMDISAQGSGFPLEDGAATRRTLFLLR
jgi:hypothetical protein